MILLKWVSFLCRRDRLLIILKWLVSRRSTRYRVSSRTCESFSSARPISPLCSGCIWEQEWGSDHVHSLKYFDETSWESRRRRGQSLSLVSSHSTWDILIQGRMNRRREEINLSYGALKPTLTIRSEQDYSVLKSLPIAVLPMRNLIQPKHFRFPLSICYGVCWRVRKRDLIICTSLLPPCFLWKGSGLIRAERE